jgi:4-amino-4-deoxy-L-arabinose transferase-like glycosyltransferase
VVALSRTNKDVLVAPARRVEPAAFVRRSRDLPANARAVAWVWAIVAAVTVMRAIADFRLPLTGDEAYYWEWSRHLAFGYVDHPPAVAWTIRAFAWLGTIPGAVRIGFVLCGVIATLAAAAAATRLAHGDRRAGAVTALAFALTPLFSMAFGSATPDGPYLAFWTLSICLALQAFDERRPIDFIVLGCALGLALLSRMFAFALLFGIAMDALAPSRRSLWRAGLGWSFVIAAALYAPFVWWNATHDWLTFDFTFVGRHVSQFKLLRPLSLYAVQAAAYSPGFFIGALVVAFARGGSGLIKWTALPLIGLLTVLALFEPVEIHWIFGPYASLCIGLGSAYVRLTRRARIIWANASVVPALLLLPLVFYAAVAPGAAYQLFRNTGSSLRNTGPFEIFTYWPLAQDVRHLAAANDAVVMTDGYGLSAVVDFYAGLTPIVIGYDWQGRESRNWYRDSEHPKRAIFLDKEELDPLHPTPLNRGRPDFKARLAQACGTVRKGPVLEYSYAGVPPRKYYTTFCDDLAPDGVRILRWEQGAPH